MKISLGKGSLLLPLLLIQLVLGSPAVIPNHDSTDLTIEADANSNDVVDTSIVEGVAPNEGQPPKKANNKVSDKVIAAADEATDKEVDVGEVLDTDTIAVPEAEKEPKEPTPQKETKEKVEEKQPAKPASKLPPPLGVDNFDTITSERLSFVEFYSPYCHHCTALAPIWEEAYLQFKTEAVKLNIQMVQVNCVESGDLCEREQISYYPNLQLYAPERNSETGELLPGKSKKVGMFPRSLVRTSENFQKYLRNSAAEYNAGTIDIPSSSELLDADQMLSILAGKKEEAYFVTFFPSTDEQWKKTESTGKSAFQKSCDDCLEYKQIWDQLSNQIQTVSKTGHFNCQTNPSLCQSMNFNELTPTNTRSTPKFVMFLPKTTGKIRFDYKGEVSIDKMKAWVNRLWQNAQFETLTARALGDVMEYRKELPHEPLDSYYPLENKISVIFYFDPDTNSDEDRAILPYLLDYVTYSPFNMYLYTSKHKKLEQGVLTQAENLVKFINADPKSSSQYKFNKASYLATTLTSKPTILIFKDNTLITDIYQNFAPEDMRDTRKIEKFINDAMYPLYQELTAELVPYYFNRPNDEHKGDKVVVTFIDSTDASSTNKQLYNISLIAHEYAYLKKEYYFNQISANREEKQSRVEKLKQQNSDSIPIIKELRREIPHLFNNNQVLFTFVDKSKKDQFYRSSKWNIDSNDYNIGDCIILTKDNRYFWDENLEGEQLTNDPTVLKPVLLSLLDPKLVNGNTPHIMLVGSPYGDSLRFMDHIHERGVLGYLSLFVILYLVFFFGRRLFKKRRFIKHKSSPSSSGAGILGNNYVPKKD
ncbi:hypothetical protein DFJ63DRAFT_323155 [Scheffersomyces coipomensis]|uniref:uncharacterized protein n=1 Tax=Scheffersomyces coipomensis TaxID=1788519 RepID=UPI00315CBC55